MSYYHVSTERLAANMLCCCFIQQHGWVHQLVALHDIAVVISILAEHLLGIESLELIVAISSSSSLTIFCNLLVGYSKVELCCSILHLDDNRSTSSDTCLYLFEFYGFCNIISRKEFEGTEVLTIERYLEWQAERSPGSTSINSAAIRCSLGCEWLVSYEILIVVKNEIIRSKRFSRCSYLLIAIILIAIRLTTRHTNVINTTPRMRQI